MKWSLTAILLAVLSTSAVFARDNCFPGNKSVLSPSYNYELTWKEGSRDSEGVEAHHLLFSRKQETQETDFFEFYNEACIHWSPDEKYFSVSHFVGSNIAEDFIYESGDVAHGVNVIGLLPEEVKNHFRKGVLHGYIETTAWNEDGLFIRAWGDRDNDPRSFDVPLKCTVNQGKWTCKTANK